MSLPQKQIESRYTRWALTTSLLIACAAATAAIEEGLEIRLGPGWQPWLFPVGLLLLNQIATHRAPLLGSTADAYFVLIALLVILSSAMGLLLVEHPPLDLVRRQQVRSHSIRIGVTALRLFLAVIGVVLIGAWARRRRDGWTRIVRWFLQGGAFLAAYGIYEFVMNLVGLKALLFPGTWGRQVDLLRAASFLYEPSQFGFFCAVALLLTRLAVRTGVLSRSRSLLLGFLYLGGLLASISGAGVYAAILGIATGMLTSFLYLRQNIRLVFLILPVLWLYVMLFFDYVALEWQHKYFQAIRSDYWNSVIRRVQEQAEGWGDVLDINPVSGGGAGATYFYKWGGFYIQWITDFGLFGVVLLIGLLGVLLRRTLETSARYPELRGHHVALGVCFLVGLFNYNAIEHLWIWIVFYFLAEGVRELLAEHKNLRLAPMPGLRQ